LSLALMLPFIPGGLLTGRVRYAQGVRLIYATTALPKYDYEK